MSEVSVKAMLAKEAAAEMMMKTTAEKMRRSVSLQMDSVKNWIFSYQKMQKTLRTEKQMG